MQLQLYCTYEYHSKVCFEWGHHLIMVGKFTRLNDPQSYMYADWSLVLLAGPPMLKRSKGRDHTKSDLLVLRVGGGMGVEILTGGVTAGVVMTLFGQSQRDTQRPIGPIISYWNVRTMVEATRVGQVHVAMEMKEYGTEVLGISEARLGHIHCT